MTARRLLIEADGGSRGNPGTAGYGAVVLDAVTGEVLAEVSEAIGRATNNVAEYSGLVAGLRAAGKLVPGATAEVRMDSKLVVEQMSGRWKIKHPDLRPLAAYYAAKPWPAASNTPAAPAETPKGLTMCTPCHQANFQGGISWPRIAGLNYDYMVAAMKAFANEERTNNQDMVKIMKLFSDSEREAMARYLAALK